ncbi:hypothetical protein [Streptomyces sp. NPDC002044]|uniref:hypothetical protein n=1 Tax=Streptomyces sp. NPDC002044 TaxID=3154662 RepID=UPI003330FFD9
MSSRWFGDRKKHNEIGDRVEDLEQSAKDTWNALRGKKKCRVCGLKADSSAAYCGNGHVL